jgi:DNA (cytosine-5)-methyltransferase 1
VAQVLGGADMMLRTLDLFSGIGGFSLGLERTGGFKTVAFCEIDPFCRLVLAKNWPEVPRYEDVRELTGARLAADGIAVDVICGGFPCQDVSENGPKVGLSGLKSGLWVEYVRLVRELRPSFVIVENVAGLLYRGAHQVLGNLAESGYDADWECVPAARVGLPQTRDRIWIVAYPCDGRQQAGHQWVAPRSVYFRWADDDRLGEAQAEADACAAQAWLPDDGVPHWVDRTRGLGNAVVPKIPELIGNAILAANGARE